MNSIYRFLLAPTKIIDLLTTPPKINSSNLKSWWAGMEDVFPFKKGVKNSQLPAVNLPGCTPPKLNIAPEKWWLEDYFPIGKLNFQGQTVKLPGCKWKFLGSDLQTSPPWTMTQVDHCSATCFSSTSIGTSTNIQGGTSFTQGVFWFSLFFWGGGFPFHPLPPGSLTVCPWKFSFPKGK